MIEERSELLAKAIYEQVENIGELRLIFEYWDELIAFCDSRECPVCPFYPCHGDQPIHLPIDLSSSLTETSK